MASKTLIICITLLVCCNSSFSQNYDPSRVNKKALALYNQGLERAQDGSYPNAVGLLLQAIQLDDKYVDAYLSLAGVYGQMKNPRLSAEYYEKAFALDTGYTLEFKLPYSISLASQGEFTKALAAINELLEKNPPKNSTSLKAAQYRQRCFAFAVDYAARQDDHSYIFQPVNLGAGVNTTESEYFPSLTIDQQELVFTRRIGGRNEDFFNSRLNDTAWLKAAPIEGFVNTELNEGAQNISQDGQWLVFTGCNRANGFGSCDIYMSFLQQDGWSEPENCGGWVNSDAWESQPCLSPDKRDLYFVSSKPGGYGGLDIYVSHYREDGKWSEAENLGPEINSAGDEQCPFIHADNQTLYFTSNFWPGYGDDDLFVSRKGPQEVWSKPQNLGYPINTINREGTLFVTADGSTAYYASDRTDSKGGLDLYRFMLREGVRPLKTFYIKGQVFDKKTTKGLPSSVELIDLASAKPVSVMRTDETGNYMITLPTGRDYALNVNRRGYLFYSENFSLSRDYKDSVYKKDIPLQPLESGASIVLNNVFFDVGKFDLQPESAIELDRMVQLLNDNPGITVEISGHTDNTGKEPENLLLSNNRAKKVVAYLVSHKINPARLTAKGLGASQPVADNSTETGRAANRRTEMRVTGKR